MKMNAKEETEIANPLSELIERHCTTIRQLFAEFRAHYVARSIGEPPGPEVMTALHTLKGSCGTIGFSRLHKKVAALHDQLKAWPQAAAPGAEYERKMAREVAETAAEVDQVRAEDSTLYGKVF
ncbi:Hpt domain-containing protein [Breoghania corrubedonensis]|uniref:Hpt domain-containing protein n=1 Tax=Breoghania corrubedonensis TaxID=665038 RepID=A0A2T5UYJ0_9HYPH|nr:Hpt domain-containing protein [Breoghania corrubedonensis]PTW56568.1 Hpt domain-containing protein [Breoghania corrubedonensis]